MIVIFDEADAMDGHMTEDVIKLGDKCEVIVMVQDDTFSILKDGDSEKMETFKIKQLQEFIASRATATRAIHKETH